MFEQLVLIVHSLAAIAMVGLILLQQGKGADMGASFGSGGSQTVLGVQGSGNLLTHATAVCATVFFATSLTLAFYAKERSDKLTGDLVIEEVVDEKAAESNAEIPGSVDMESAAEEVPVIVDEEPAMTSEKSSAEEVPALPDAAEGETEVPAN